MTDAIKTVRCGTHGQAGLAFACSHLIHEKHQPLGFFYTEPDSENPEPQAWCRSCEAALAEVGDWTDELLARADIRVVCEFCFDTMRHVHAGAA